MPQRGKDPFVADYDLDVVPEVGGIPLRELQRLSTHLDFWHSQSDLNNIALPSRDGTRSHDGTQTSDVLPDLRYRYAPSIITRSEAEVFGFSYPRFAIRATFPQGKGFLNLRRQQLVSKCTNILYFRRIGIRKPVGESIIDPDNAVTWVPDFLGSTSISPDLKKNSPIADCILRAPHAARELYRVIEADLSAAYGEERANATGSAYIKHIALQGGGLCAQAACFTVAVMLHSLLPHCHSKPHSGVHGIAEITSIISKDENEFLHLTGLQHRRTGEYLDRIGLSAPLQSVSTVRRGKWVSAENRHKLFRTAIRSYTVSGLPSIIPVMQSCLPWNRDLRKIDRKNHRDDPNHAVVVIGCGKQGEATEDRFLINDPAELPFLEINAGDLGFAAGWLNRDFPGRTESFFAATHRNVRMTLETTGIKSGPEVETRMGLFDLAIFFQTAGNNLSLQWLHAGLRHTGEGVTLGEFQLLHLGASAAPHRFGLDSLRIVPLAAAKEFVNAIKDRRTDEWVWIQYRPNDSNPRTGTAWIWKAEYDLRHFLWKKNKEQRSFWEEGIMLGGIRDAGVDNVLHGVYQWNGKDWTRAYPLR